MLVNKHLIFLDPWLFDLCAGARKMLQNLGTLRGR
jgi:hypothetical protein